MLQNWLSPLNTKFEKSNFFDARFETESDFPELLNAKVAFVVVDKDFGDKIRIDLNRFKNHFSDLSIVDIGDVRKKNSEFILQIIVELIDSGIVPVIIGAEVELCLKVQAYLENICHSNMLSVISNQVKSELLDQEYAMFFGFQRHLVDLNVVSDSEFSVNSLSLGQIRTQAHLVEPMLRESNVAYVDMNVMRRNEVLACKESLPTGLNAEELCQVARYVGEASELKAVIFNTENIEESASIQESIIMSEAIWYLLEGISLKISDHPMKSKEYQEFVVNGTDEEHEFTFYQNKLTHRWWFKATNGKCIPCSHQDYQNAINNELPERLMLRY